MPSTLQRISNIILSPKRGSTSTTTTAAAGDNHAHTSTHSALRRISDIILSPLGHSTDTSKRKSCSVTPAGPGLLATMESQRRRSTVMAGGPAVRVKSILKEQSNEVDKAVIRR